jgi:hypothetical protein
MMIAHRPDDKNPLPRWGSAVATEAGIRDNEDDRPLTTDEQP